MKPIESAPSIPRTPYDDGRFLRERRLGRPNERYSYTSQNSGKFSV